MPICVHQQQRLHFTVEGDHGPFLLCHLPPVLSLDSWYRANYIEPLKKDFRLILLDPVGQGRSDVPEDPKHYQMDQRIFQIRTILQSLNVEGFHYLGFGLGGQIGFELAYRYPRAVRSLTVVGAHPYPISAESSDAQQQLEILQEQGVPAYLEKYKTSLGLSKENIDLLKESSQEAAIGTLKETLQWPGMAKHLRKITVPTLLMTATKEPAFMAIRDAGRTMSTARYLILPEIRYTEGILDAELAMEPLMEFIHKNR